MARLSTYIFLLLCAVAPFSFAEASSGALGLDGGETIIVIDPGHGGEDTGAVGPDGVAEKDVALKVALRVASRLREVKGFRVYLTRENDTFIPLEERTQFANALNADLLVSIHANAALSRHARGVETFFLSFDATDEEARLIAESENSSGPSGGLSPDGPEDLKKILFDLVRTEAHHESSALAETIQTSLLKATGQENRGVKQAPFVVLSGAVMPAVLVEVGFISNPAEEKRLSSKGEQSRIADAVADGIISFSGALGKTGPSAYSEIGYNR